MPWRANPGLRRCLEREPPNANAKIYPVHLELSKAIFDDFALSDGHLDYFGVLDRAAGSHDVLLLQNSPIGARGSLVAIKGTFFGHCSIGCLLKTSQATPRMIWAACTASTEVLSGANHFGFFSMSERTLRGSRSWISVSSELPPMYFPMGNLFMMDLAAFGHSVHRFRGDKVNVDSKGKNNLAPAAERRRASACG